MRSWQSEFGRSALAELLIDDAVVRRRLRRLDELLQGLREIGARSREEFLDDSTSQHAAAWCLQRAIQAVLNIGAHILAERGVVDWEEYSEIPKRLARDCGLPAELAARLEKAAGQRNILVHMYVEVDPELIYKTLQEGLDAFNEFAEYVLRVLEG